MHLLEKYHVEIACSKQETAKHLQNEISDVFQKKLYPKLDDLFKHYEIPENTWKINKIEISIENLVLSNWKNDLVNGIIKQVEAFLRDNQPQIRTNASKINKDVLVSEKRNYQELLIFYLLDGDLPPNAITNDLDKIFTEVNLDRDFVKLFLGKIKDANQINDIALRIVFNFTQLLTGGLAESFRVNQSFKIFEDTLLKEGKKHAGFLKFLFWKSSLIKSSSLKPQGNPLKFYKTYFNLSQEEILIEANNLNKLLKALELKDIKLLKILSNEINNLKQIISRPEVDSENNQASLQKNEIDKILEALQGNSNKNSAQNYTYVNNAGLVILHPFLTSLFDQLGYWKDQKWKAEKYRHRAVLLLHYLVYGKSKVFENELVLNKVICGVEASTPVSTKWQMTKTEAAKCDELLSSAIEHWSILKDTSVSTLRETFLQREAKLVSFKENKYELIVEQQSIDVLLDHLPWGIGMLKTPWMKNYLSCLWV